MANVLRPRAKLRGNIERVRFGHIATLGCTAKIGSYRGKADIKRVLPKDLDL